jgi:hypothetical protein
MALLPPWIMSLAKFSGKSMSRTSLQNHAPIVGLQKDQVRPVSRTSPQIDGNVLYFGTLTHALAAAVNRLTGKLLGTVQTNPLPLAVVTMSPTFFDGKLFV